MSFDPVPSSNNHGNLDEEISQLMQCKPLSEQEVPFLISVFFLCFFGFWMSFEIVRSGRVPDRIWFGRVCVSFAGGVVDFCEILGWKTVICRAG